MSWIHESLIKSFEDLLCPQVERDEAERRKNGEYRYIALSLDRFIKQIGVVRGLLHEGSPHFVDVGCGIGTKLLLAKSLFSYGVTISGIEKDAEYLEVAKRLVPSATLIHADALKQNYSAYDIIYFYCPLSNSEKQIRLENRIIRTMKKGAYVLANMKQAEEKRWETAPMKRIWENVIYQKVSA